MVIALTFFKRIFTLSLPMNQTHNPIIAGVHETCCASTNTMFARLAGGCCVVARRSAKTRKFTDDRRSVRWNDRSSVEHGVRENEALPRSRRRRRLLREADETTLAPGSYALEARLDLLRVELDVPHELVPLLRRERQGESTPASAPSVLDRRSFYPVGRSLASGYNSWSGTIERKCLSTISSASRTGPLGEELAVIFRAFTVVAATRILGWKMADGIPTPAAGCGGIGVDGRCQLVVATVTHVAKAVEMSVLRLDKPEPRVPKRVGPVQGLEQRRVNLTRAVRSDSRLLTKTLDSVHVTANKPGTRCSAEHTHLSRRRSCWTHPGP
jgi:hypothetical protein